ncbi:hypothetical protein NDU88_003362 [Pleurodeles waltl]|uniref:Uncharacterized protein n=1 Tax=Pleurodeles waltl TaxID=8319 RepID=A0AAV7NI00_PLEWA|nr:hypothetical protein NDU88_003362 [Pleurodeles waltl]
MVWRRSKTPKHCSNPQICSRAARKMVSNRKTAPKQLAVVCGGLQWLISQAHRTGPPICSPAPRAIRDPAARSCGSLMEVAGGTGLRSDDLSLCSLGDP